MMISNTPKREFVLKTMLPLLIRRRSIKMIKHYPHISGYTNAPQYSATMKPRVRVQLAESFKSDENFLVLRRIKVDTSTDQLLAYSTGYQGSGNLNSLVLADGLTLLEPGHSGRKGTWCDALLL